MEDKKYYVINGLVDNENLHKNGPYDTIEQCQQAVRDYIDGNDLGSSQWDGGDVWASSQFGVFYEGRISYNGKYWPSEHEYGKKQEDSSERWQSVNSNIKLKDLIAMADNAYPDGKIMQYFEDPNGQHGDTLAQFICYELQSTFEEDQIDEDKLEEARRVIETAMEEVSAVHRAFDNAFEFISETGAFDPEEL